MPEGTGGLSGPSLVDVWREERIYVADWQKGGVLVYDADGTPLRTIGRPGSGAGEIEGPIFSLGWLGDTLYVSDMAGRVTYFSPDGVLLGATAVEGRIVPGTLYPTGMAAPLALPASFTNREGERTRTPVVEVSRDGRMVDTIGFTTTRAPVVVGAVGGATWELSAPQPYADDPLLMRTGDGRVYYDLERPAATSAEGAAFTLRALTRSGEELWRRSYPYVPVPTRPEAADSAALVAAERAPAALPRPELAVRLQRLVYLPPFQPPVRQMQIQRDGSLWLQREAGALGDRWDVLGPDGAPLGSVSLPAGVTPARATDAHLYAWGRSPEGVVGLIRYRIEGR